MGKASKICPTIGCTNLLPCAEHERKPWAGSTHNRNRTISGSKEQARSRKILMRDRYVCHVCGGFGANQADHVIPLAEGGQDDESNLAAIHAEPCHRAKTAREAARGRLVA